MTIFERLYYLGYVAKRYLALRNQKKLSSRVISIGNITVGGTGKTPAAIALAEKLKNNGLMPCILTRGYKGAARGPCLVSNGTALLMEERQVGDEALLMAEKLKGIPVIKGKDRYKAGVFALSILPPTIRPDVFILDDGFQHWSLFRDIDILLIDSTNPFGHRRLLPLGILREPLEAIRRADIIVITRTNCSVIPTGISGNLEPTINNLIKEIRRYNERGQIFFAKHSPLNFMFSTGDVRPLEWAKEKRFYGFCGIGNPGSFKETLLTLGVELGGFKTFKDHHRYNSEDIKNIIDSAKSNSASWIVTTEKDIMRLKDFNLPENFVSLCIEFSVDQGLYERILEVTQKL
ncbi:MAG: tetraacyldisaccharide 4'-kinase [Nitrospirota bacterium]